HYGPRGHGGDDAGTREHGGMGHGGGRFVQRFTVATGYVALGLLALTLLIGPATLLLHRRNPVSNYLRRDVGMWTAIFSLVHVIFGLQLHGTGQPSPLLDYFVAPNGSPLTNSFGLGNWIGLAALVIVAGVVAIFRNFALRQLKDRPWERAQPPDFCLFRVVLPPHCFLLCPLPAT